ncbi:hypothetical protein H1P_4760001 [Hyella patelloides LEGE 07179]|uniref:Uncharacterized protein n=1 Tax=Hyella patelloides LEGE 07179 TaxID=945734 RepID=A0A563VYX7_9CYAN|nr:hypothetical protein [Hyella patelloides]VEP16629.1 hypothetical protein H1P_4760001 [Hyella patelloides LEGE 07179]
MNSNNQVVTQPSAFPENETPNLDPLPNGSSPVGIILAISILVGAIAKLIEVLVPVMKKTK